MINYYNTDCNDFMKDLPDNHFQLAITDPPYGIDAPNMVMGSSTQNGKKYHSTTQKQKKAKFSKGSGKLKNRALNTMDLGWDVKPDESYFKELFRISKHQIIWGGNYFNLPPSRGVICWDKMQPWENFSQWEMAWTSFNKPASMVRISTTGGHNKIEKIHPTQKPIKLYLWLLKKYAQTGDRIFDSHLGSGSIGIACHKLGYELDACEKDKSYFQKAKAWRDSEIQKSIVEPEIKFEYEQARISFN